MRITVVLARNRVSEVLLTVKDKVRRTPYLGSLRTELSNDYVVQAVHQMHPSCPTPCPTPHRGRSVDPSRSAYTSCRLCSSLSTVDDSVRSLSYPITIWFPRPATNAPSSTLHSIVAHQSSTPPSNPAQNHRPALKIQHTQRRSSRWNPRLYARARSGRISQRQMFAASWWLPPPWMLSSRPAAPKPP